MTTRNPAALLAVLGISCLSGCGGGGGGGNSGVANFSTGLAVAATYPQAVASLGGLAFFLVDEVEQGETDLNGDGDVADNVLHVLDTATGITTNLLVATDGTMVAGASVLFFLVSETAQGGLDANGNLDANDFLLGIYDPNQPLSVSNPRIEPPPIHPGGGLAADGDTVAFVVLESELGAPLNASAAADAFVGTYDFVTTNFLFAPFASTETAPFQFRNGLVAYSASESLEELDINGNGLSEDVLVVFRPDGSLTQVVGPPAGRAVLEGAFRIGGTLAAPFLIYAADEAGLMVSLNASGLVADNDVEDTIAAIWDVVGAVESLPGGGIAIQPHRLQISETRATFATPEDENGALGTDLNSDLDAEDVVPFWVDLSAPSVAQNVGIAQNADEDSFYPILCDDFLVLLAVEAEQGQFGTNYNSSFGDTDVEDSVPFFVSVRTANVAAVNIGIASNQFICSDAPGRWIFIVGVEADNNGADLNDFSPGTDQVPGYIRVRSDNTLVLPPVFFQVDGNSVVQDCGATLRLVTFMSEGKFPELWRMNDDDDITDHGLVLQQIDTITGEFLERSIGGVVEPEVAMATFPVLVGNTAVVFPTMELSFGITGRNLNQGMGDADVFDTILSYSTLSCP